MSTITLAGMIGSLRRDSYNRGLMRAAIEAAPPGLTIEEVDIASLPLYNEDLDAEGAPPPVAELRQRIAEADGLLIATPEYNYGVPGPLKNALDWASRPPEDSCLNRKPVAIMGASPARTGTARAQLALRPLFVWTNSLVMPRPELYAAEAWRSFADDGTLTDDGVREQLGEFLAGVADWVAAHAPVASAA
jgi:chromate reductase, NAD(P)H dehydrogenase (quinone)